MNTIYKLTNPIQHYAWGSRTAIPELLGRDNPDNKPWAELWMGAHPKAPSWADCGGSLIALPDLIAQDPNAMLGAEVNAAYDGRLPFLFKVLAAGQPLSIQAHPNLDQAREGFERENQAGIPLDAPHRNYRDANHKPETLCALTPFWAVRGFRHAAEIVSLAQDLGLAEPAAELARLQREPGRPALRAFFEALMTMPNERKATVVRRVAEAAGTTKKKDPVSEWIEKLHARYPGDIGVLCPIFLNLIRLEPGQAMYLPAGELHAYLDGLGMELMANSDNVLRGGLTPKHMDLPELLGLLTFSDQDIELLAPEMQIPAEHIYPKRTDEFLLSVLTPTDAQPYQSEASHGVEILFCTQGEGNLEPGPDVAGLPFRQGDSFFVPASAPDYRLTGNATLYRAAIP